MREDSTLTLNFPYKPMREKLFTFIVLLCLILCMAMQAGAQAKTPSEYAVKAAFLYNFTKFVEWPSDVLDENDSLLQICVIGENPFGDELENIIEGKKVGGKSVMVTYAQSVKEAVFCDVVFISQSEKKKLNRILKVLTNRAILTVSDIDDFAERGGTIGFFVEDNRIRFKINIDTAEKAGLQISSKLLRLAQIVN